MKARTGRKKAIRELGGNAGVIVDESADIAWAVKRVATGGFAYAGQSCISVQRVFVHERVYDRGDDRAQAARDQYRAGVNGFPLAAIPAPDDNAREPRLSDP